MRQCTICLKDQPLESFPWKNKKKGVSHKQCRECRRGYGRKHYQRNPAYYKAKAHKNEAAPKRRRQYVWDYLLEHPCVDCGEQDPVVLEFDHVNPSDKVQSVSNLISRYTLSILITEINKCEVRCANCHRRKTAAQLGYYQDIRTLPGMLDEDMLAQLF